MKLSDVNLSKDGSRAAQPCQPAAAEHGWPGALPSPGVGGLRAAEGGGLVQDLQDAEQGSQPATLRFIALHAL